MPNVSQSPADLSESLSSLSQRAKVAEDRAAKAGSGTHEELQARIEEVKAAAAHRHELAKAGVADAKDDMASDWAKLRGRVDEHFEKMRARIEARRDVHDVKTAERSADSAEQYAVEAVEWAYDVIDWAESAVLYAIDARRVADLKARAHSSS